MTVRTAFIGVIVAAAVATAVACTEDERPRPEQNVGPDDGQPRPSRPNTLHLPALSEVSSDCEVPEAESVTVATWAGAADDIVVGTVLGYRVVWEPLWRDSARGFVELQTCAEARPAIELDLADVQSLIGRDVEAELSVRLGVGTWQVWGNSPIAELGTDDEQVDGWTLDDYDVPRPFEAGMRVGAAVYTHPSVDAPVVMSARREPLFEVVDGHAWFQLAQATDECTAAAPSLETVDGLPLERLGALLTEAASDADPGSVERYRESLGLDPELSNDAAPTTYAARCRRLVGETPPEDSTPLPCDGDDACPAGAVCSNAICVPQTTGWEED